MPRPPRIQFPGANYLVVTRSNADGAALRYQGTNRRTKNVSAEEIITATAQAYRVKLDD